MLVGWPFAKERRLDSMHELRRYRLCIHFSGNWRAGLGLLRASVCHGRDSKTDDADASGGVNDLRVALIRWPVLQDWELGYGDKKLHYRILQYYR